MNIWACHLVPFNILKQGGEKYITYKQKAISIHLLSWGRIGFCIV